MTANNSFLVPNCPMPKATFIELGIYRTDTGDEVELIYPRNDDQWMKISLVGSMSAVL